MKSKKPPDKYKCIKVHFSSLLKDNIDYSIIFDSIVSIHKITIKIYQLLRLYILHCYHQKIQINPIDKILLRKIKNVIIQKKMQDKTYDLLHSLYKEEYEENPKKLCFVFEEVFTTIIVALENNIKNHYFDYLRRFINSYFSNEDKKELYSLKNDIIFNDSKNEKFKLWLNENRNKIIPFTNDNDSYFHYKNIKENPYLYLEKMIYMNEELEKINGKMFQCMPLRNDCIPKNIVLDTSTLNNIFEKGIYQKELSSMKDFLWSKYFHINVKKKDYIFDHCIITDGVSVSLRFIHKYELNKNIVINQKKTAGRKRGKEKNQLLKQEKEQNNKKIKEIVSNIQENLKSKKVKHGSKFEQKCMTLEDKRDIIIDKYEEFPYFDDVSKDIFLNKKRVFIDPGKNTLLQMMDDNGVISKYTNAEKMFHRKQQKYNRIIKNHKDNLDITKKENELSSFNFKTCNIENFQKAIQQKNKINKIVLEKYQDEKFRKYKWYAYIQKKKEENKMINKIKSKYGSDILLIHGNWNQTKQMKHLISTPNLCIRKKLNEHFDVYLIDEYKTSKLCYKNEKECKNLYLKGKKIHTILTYQMENNRLGCINRDKNSTFNMKKIFDHYIKTGQRLQNYQRCSTAVKSRQ